MEIQILQGGMGDNLILRELGEYYESNQNTYRNTSMSQIDVRVILAAFKTKTTRTSTRDRCINTF